MYWEDSASCNASNWHKLISCIYLSLPTPAMVFLHQQGVRAKDGEEFIPAVGTGNLWEEENWFSACLIYNAQVACWQLESWTYPNLSLCLGLRFVILFPLQVGVVVVVLSIVCCFFYFCVIIFTWLLPIWEKWQITRLHLSKADIV